MAYRFLPHTADARVAIEAATFGELLADCVAVVRELAAGDSPVAAREQRAISVAADHPQETLMLFVRQLLEGFALDAFIPVAFDPAQVDPRAARGILSGERFDPRRHAAQPEVKALTRHGLEVRETAQGWNAELLFDL